MWWVRKGVVDLCLPMSPLGTAPLCCSRHVGALQAAGCDWNSNHLIPSLLQSQLSFSHFFLSVLRRIYFFPSCVCFRCFSLWHSSSACISHYWSWNKEKSKGQMFSSTFPHIFCISHLCAFTKGNTCYYGDRPALLQQLNVFDLFYPAVQSFCLPLL